MSTHFIRTNTANYWTLLWFNLTLLNAKFEANRGVGMVKNIN